MNKKSLLSTPYILWTVLFTIVPLIIILIFSLSASSKIGSLSTDFTLDRYVQFFEPIYADVFFRSIKLSLYSTVFCLILGYPVAYIIANKKMRIRNFLILFIILPQWTNFLLRTYAWMSILKDNGPINSFLINIGLIKEPLTLLYTDGAVLMGMVYNFLPYMILPIYTVILKIDKAYVEAARDLGASSAITFRKIILPLSMPGIVSGIIMVFMPAISTFVISDLLGGGHSMLMGNLIQNQFLAARNWQFGSAISMILIAIILITMLVLNRYSSSDKGGALW
ncbi:ABC transporter, permease protein [Peptostreptococcaceae bacterium AS15]|jgi:spermidine/putrescine ABC superfamily ATP binding cassette transporter, permease protein|nr:ABC transporter, permease protein [Peptostreptococcaceae bacterium AS15]RKW57786.1 MAG: ABC transporter permease [Lachnospiraceae bacterium]SKC40296.1 spermidine/putrescine transport system permease protein [[Eubacterium] yurii]